MKIIKKKSKIKLKIRKRLTREELIDFLFDLYHRKGCLYVANAIKNGVSPKDITPDIVHKVQARMKQWHRDEAEKINKARMAHKPGYYWCILEGDSDWDPRLNPEFARKIYEDKLTPTDFKDQMLHLLPKKVPVSIPNAPNAGPLSRNIVSKEGKRFKIFGFSVRSVLHWMGQDDFPYAEVRIVFDKLGIEMSESSIKVALSESGNEERAIPADLSKAQKKEIYSLLK